jgi:hypothetical protein
VTDLARRDPADLLAERRATIREMRGLDRSRAADRTAHATLWYSIQLIDLELERRRLRVGVVAS